MKGANLYSKTCDGKRGTFGSDMLIASRQASKTRGDLSNIRPKSPPLYDLSVALGGLWIDGRYLAGIRSSCDEDDHDLHSEKHNCARLEASNIRDSLVFPSPIAAQQNKLSTSESWHANSRSNAPQVCLSGLNRLYATTSDNLVVCKDTQVPSWFSLNSVENEEAPCLPV